MKNQEVIEQAKRENAEEARKAGYEPAADLAGMEPRELLVLSEVARQLAEIESLDGVKEIRDKAEAVRLYLKKQNHSLASQNSAAAVRLRAERRMGELLGKMELQTRSAENLKRGPRLQRETSGPTLSDLGLSKSQSHRSQAIARLPEDEFEAFLHDYSDGNKEITSKEAYKLAKKREAKKTVSVNNGSDFDEHGICSDLESLSGEKFGTVYADPPWQYGNQQTRSATDNHYPTMSIGELRQMPIAELAADDAHLHLWTTNGFLQDAFRVMSAWGFEYRSCFIWVKPQLGIGNYWRVSHEFLLLGIRGNAKRFGERTHRSWEQYDRTKHSAKPEEVRHKIEAVSPGPRLELFGRRPIAGWTVFGNQIESRLFAG